MSGLTNLSEMSPIVYLVGRFIQNKLYPVVISGDLALFGFTNKNVLKSRRILFALGEEIKKLVTEHKLAIGLPKMFIILGDFRPLDSVIMKQT